MELALRIALGIAALLMVVAGVGWYLWWLLKNSYDAAALLFRWIVSVVVIGGGYFSVDRMIGPNGGPAEKIFGLFVFMFIGIIMAILWVPAIVNKAGSLFGSLLTGGDEPAPPQPYYSVALTKRQQGKFREALYEIQQQLATFPNDVTGQMLLAQIQAENLHDLPAAQLTIDRLIHQPGHSPPQIANALSSLADYHLKLHDPEAAAAALEQIIARLPDTDQARMAAQRIAHLPSKELLLAGLERKPLELRQGVRDIGLLRDSAVLAKPEQDPAEIAQQLAKHLELHPLDGEAREKLALIYAGHYQRLDLAANELEDLITAPNQQGKEVARWLNLLADLQLRHGADYDTIRHTLQRVVDLFPGLAAAQLAQQRLEHLRLELKGKEQGQVVKLGTYEKFLGLKGPGLNS